MRLWWWFKIVHRNVEEVEKKAELCFERVEFSFVNFFTTSLVAWNLFFFFLIEFSVLAYRVPDHT